MAKLKIGWTTLNLIRAEGPCEDGWIKLLKHLGKKRADDKPLSLLTVLESNGVDDALWCLRAAPGIDKIARLFAADCAARALRFDDEQDPRSRKAVTVARAFAHGKATKRQLDAAWAAARDAARDAAVDAARDAAIAAAWNAARDAAWAAARDAWAAARDAARDAEHTWQAARLRLYLTSKTLPKPVPLPPLKRKKAA